MQNADRWIKILETKIVESKKNSFFYAHKTFMRTFCLILFLLNLSLDLIRSRIAVSKKDDIQNNNLTFTRQSKIKTYLKISDILNVSDPFLLSPLCMALSSIWFLGSGRPNQ